MSGEQLIDVGDFVIGNTAQNIGEPCLRIDAIELGGLDQRINDGRRSAAAFLGVTEGYPKDK